MRLGGWFFAVSAVAALALGACRDFDRFRAGQTPGAGGNGGDVGGAGGEVSVGGGGSGVGGGAGGGGGGEPAVCGFIDVLNDDFTAAKNDPVWTDDHDGEGSNISVINGAYVLELDVDDSYALFGTETAYDMTGRTLTIDIEELSRTTDHVLWFDIGATKSFDDKVEMYVEGTDLILARHIDDSHQDVAAPVPFDPVAMRYWRYREADGNIHLETSPDGADWEIRAVTPHDIIYDIRYTYAEIGITGDGQGTGANVSIGSVVGGPTEGVLCDAHTLTDDFEDGEVDNAWAGYGDSGCVGSEAGGHIRFDVGAGASGDDCGYISQRAFDFGNSSVSLELIDIPAEGEAWFYIVDPDQSNGIGFNVSGGTLTAEVGVDNVWVNQAMVPFDPDAHRFVRIREDGGTLHWEVSSDGGTFTGLQLTTTLFDPSVMRIDFGGGADGTTTGALTVELDNVNLP